MTDTESNLESFFLNTPQRAKVLNALLHEKSALNSQLRSSIDIESQKDIVLKLIGIIGKDFVPKIITAERKSAPTLRRFTSKYVKAIRFFSESLTKTYETYLKDIHNNSSIHGKEILSHIQQLNRVAEEMQKYMLSLNQHYINQAENLKGNYTDEYINMTKKEKIYIAGIKECYQKAFEHINYISKTAPELIKTGHHKWFHSFITWSVGVYFLSISGAAISLTSEEYNEVEKRLQGIGPLLITMASLSKQMAEKLEPFTSSMAKDSID